MIIERGGYPKRKTNVFGRALKGAVWGAGGAVLVGFAAWATKEGYLEDPDKIAAKRQNSPDATTSVSLVPAPVNEPAGKGESFAAEFNEAYIMEQGIPRLIDYMVQTGDPRLVEVSSKLRVLLENGKIFVAGLDYKKPVVSDGIDAFHRRSLLLGVPSSLNFWGPDVNFGDADRVYEMTVALELYNFLEGFDRGEIVQLFTIRAGDRAKYEDMASNQAARIVFGSPLGGQFKNPALIAAANEFDLARSSGDR